MKSAPDREEDMRFQERGIRAWAAFAAGAFVLSLTLTLGAARAGEKTYVM